MAIAVDTAGKVKANPKTGEIMGGSNASSGTDISPLVSNLLNYQTSKLTGLSTPTNTTSQIYQQGGVNKGQSTYHPTTGTTSKGPSAHSTTSHASTPSADTATNTTANNNLKNSVSSGVYSTLKNYAAGLQEAGPGGVSLIGPTGEVRPTDGNGNVIGAGVGNVVNMSPDGKTGTAGTGTTGTGTTGTGSGGYSGSGYSGGSGGGYSNASAILNQLTGTGLTGVAGTGTGNPYTYISQAAGNNPEAAAAYLQLLQNAGYDLSQPLTDIALPNRVDLPEEVALPENFDFLNAYNNIPEVQVGRIDRVDTHPEEEMLGQIADLQSQQAILSANNTVNNGITELQRVMQDAQDQYQAQRDQIAMDEQRAKDNQALYSEARGDRGGIGQAQYDSIQNTAATNRLTVQKEQTQLATDTARQIADLRSQGEFEKANQLLSISQKYLSELMDLYQWAKETNVSIDEFNLQVAQWEENFKLSLVGAELDAEAFNLNVANAMMDQQNNLFNAALNQENSLFDARLNAAKLQNDEALSRLNAQLNAANATGSFANGTPTYAAIQDAISNQLKERSMLADIGKALIKAGIQPSGAILEAMGMGGTATADTTGTGTLSSVLSSMGYSDATSALRAMGIGNSGLAGIAALGYTPEQFLAEALGVSTGLSGLQTLGTTNAVSTGGEQIYNQLAAPTQTQTTTPNTQSQVAAYTQQQATTPTYTDANVYAAFGADPVTVLKAMGIGNDGLAGLSMLGISPAQLLGEAFGL